MCAVELGNEGYLLSRETNGRTDWLTGNTTVVCLSTLFLLFWDYDTTFYPYKNLKLLARGAIRSILMERRGFPWRRRILSTYIFPRGRCVLSTYIFPWRRCVLSTYIFPWTRCILSTYIFPWRRCILSIYIRPSFYCSFWINAIQTESS